MKHLSKKFKSYFAAGLVVLAPLFLSIIFIGYLFKLVDAFVVNPVFQVLPWEVDAGFKIFLAKAAIALVAAACVTFIGYLARKFLVTNLFNFGEAILKSIPVFNRVYILLKEITDAFFDDKKGLFKRAVFLEYPRKGIYALGFVTQERPWELGQKTGRQLVSVFVPSPPNPATGMFVFVPVEELIETTVTVEEAVKLVISGGAAVPIR